MLRNLVKVVFKEGKDEKPKVVWGYVLDDSFDFLKLETTSGFLFNINKQNIIFTKQEGTYK